MVGLIGKLFGLKFADQRVVSDGTQCLMQKPACWVLKGYRLPNDQLFRKITVFGSK